MSCVRDVSVGCCHAHSSHAPGTSSSPNPIALSFHSASIARASAPDGDAMMNEAALLHVLRHHRHLPAYALAQQRFGRLDAVIANAGATLARSIDDTTDEDIERTLAVNLRAVVYLAQSAHSSLAQTSGSFIVMASKTGLVAQRDSPIYCASKGAVVQLARALSLDWAPEGIRVNALCPGIVDTPMLEKFFDELPDPDRARQEFATAQPLGRLAQPRECASAALFLASDSASFITGVALPVDGGFTAQ